VKKIPEVTEFDRYADHYRAVHAKNTDFFEKDVDYFARYKIEHIVRHSKKTTFNPQTVLDFGCGVGNSVQLLIDAFPLSIVSGADVSTASIDIAKKRVPACSSWIELDEGSKNLTPDYFEAVLIACVLHHIVPKDRFGLLSNIHRCMKPGGKVFVFEHNPYNPLTQRAVSTCPLDENANLLSLRQSKALFQRAGFDIEVSQYTLFFPNSLSKLRLFEPALDWLPLGGQYCLIASKK
jgi:ubiquinone/menaquinone biosynthesis C-methylase UbiE